MKERIAKLIDVKTIITMVILAVFVVLAVRKDIPSEYCMAVITMVISFYFGTQSAKKSE